MDWDVIVIGGGAAGLSASLMLGRAGRRTLVVDAGAPRNRFAEHMHGVLGNEGTPPAKLLSRGKTEAAGYGVEFTDGTVERVDLVDAGAMVRTTTGRRWTTRAVIVATGLTDDLPDIPGLAERWGKSVLHCPYCHGWEVRNRRLGVLTTSPLQLHLSELVRQWSDRVVVFTAGLGELTPETEQRLGSRGIELVAEPVAEVLGAGGAVEAVRLADGREVPLDAVFTGGIPRPHDGFLSHLGLRRTDTPAGSFLAVDQMNRTSGERIWAVGNVVNPSASVPLSIGAGAFTGAAVNAALVTEDFDLAVAGRASVPGPAERSVIV